MTVNIRARSFNFDSIAPVQGMVYDEGRELAKTQMIHSAIHTIVALDVVAAGAWVCKWWYFGGFQWAYWAFQHWCPWLLRMVTQGAV